MKDLVPKVDEILFSFWDPIAVGDSREAKDEYSAYAPGIARCVMDGASAAVLAARLLQIEQVDMGLPGDLPRAERVAQALLELVAR